jgi:hypothetical protein
MILRGRSGGGAGGHKMRTVSLLSRSLSVSLYIHYVFVSRERLLSILSLFCLFLSPFSLCILSVSISLRARALETPNCLHSNHDGRWHA